MDIVGVTTDVPVVDLGRALPFYSEVLGRGPDLRPDDRTLEWILHRTPEIAVRVVAGRQEVETGHGGWERLAGFCLENIRAMSRQ